jgi:hypothetical protein
MARPEVSMVHRAQATIAKFGELFGFNPVGRTRLGTHTQDFEFDNVDGILS